MILQIIFDLQKLKATDVIDILLVALLLYQFYRLIRGTGAMYIFIGIIALYLIFRTVKAFHLELLGEILSLFSSVGFIALIVVFQPEIRKFLFMLGKPNIINKKHRRFMFWRLRFNKESLVDVDPIIIACEKMARNRTGALIVVAHQHDLQEYIDTGEKLDARVSEELIENIFFKNSPLHDGALIIRDNRILAARCILPVSANQDIPANFGLRHRAAAGITEQTDASAIVVSEQTGMISYCRLGDLKSGLMPAGLKQLLKEEFTNS